MNTLLHFLLCQSCRSLRNASLCGPHIPFLGSIKRSYHDWLSMMTLLTCLTLQTCKLSRWIWYILSYEMAKALLRLTAVWDTKQAGDLRGDTVQFVVLDSCVACNNA